MNIPGIVKFILVSALGYKLITFKPVKKLLVTYLVAKGAKMLSKKLAA